LTFSYGQPNWIPVAGFWTASNAGAETVNAAAVDAIDLGRLAAEELTPSLGAEL
jgi:hypothetical protein